jgi:hypothetical protein
MAIGVSSLRSKKIVFRVLVAASFIALFPISVRLADPLFTHPFRTGWQYEYPVLLVWPDHVELRWFHDVSEISPRPKDSSYTFNVSPARQSRIEEEVRRTPSPNANAAWIIHINQLGASRQQIQLELLGDGITGIVYQAEPDRIVPVHARLAGPAGAFEILIVHLLLCGGCWMVVRLILFLLALQRKQSAIAL